MYLYFECPVPRQSTDDITSLLRIFAFTSRNSSRTMPLVGGFFSGVSRVPGSSFQRYSPHSTLIGSQDLAVKSRPNLFTHNSRSRCSQDQYDAGKCKYKEQLNSDYCSGEYRQFTSTLSSVAGNLCRPQRVQLALLEPSSRIVQNGSMVGGFSRGSPFSPALSLRRAAPSILTSNALIGSQDLAIKSRPNLLISLLTGGEATSANKPNEEQLCLQHGRMIANPVADVGMVSVDQHNCDKWRYMWTDIPDVPARRWRARNVTAPLKSPFPERFLCRLISLEPIASCVYRASPSEIAGCSVTEIGSSDGLQPRTVYTSVKSKVNVTELAATVTERFARSPFTKAIRVQSPSRSLRIFASGNRAGRFRWSAVFFSALLHSHLDHPFGSEDLAQISSLTLHCILFRSQLIGDSNLDRRKSGGNASLDTGKRSVPEIRSRLCRVTAPSLGTRKFREFNDLQARLRSLMYKYADISCTLLGCCSSGRRRLGQRFPGDRLCLSLVAEDNIVLCCPIPCHFPAPPVVEAVGTGSLSISLLRLPKTPSLRRCLYHPPRSPPIIACSDVLRTTPDPWTLLVIAGSRMSKSAVAFPTFPRLLPPPTHLPSLPPYVLILNPTRHAIINLSCDELGPVPYRQRDGNTARQFRNLRVEAMAHLMRVAVSPFSTLRARKQLAGHGDLTARFPPGQTGFKLQSVHSRISARGNRAGRYRWSAGFFSAISSFPLPFHSDAVPFLTSFHPRRLSRPRRPDLSTTRTLHARLGPLRFSGNSPLDARDSVALIDPTLLGLKRGEISSGLMHVGRALKSAHFTVNGLYTGAPRVGNMVTWREVICQSARRDERSGSQSRQQTTAHSTAEPIRRRKEREHKGDTPSRIKYVIATKRKALNRRAVFSSHCVCLREFQRRHCYFIGGKSEGRFNAGVVLYVSEAMSLVGGFPQESPAFFAPAFRPSSMPPLHPRRLSRPLDVKSSLNLSTRSLEHCTLVQYFAHSGDDALDAILVKTCETLEMDPYSSEFLSPGSNRHQQKRGPYHIRTLISEVLRARQPQGRDWHSFRKFETNREWTIVIATVKMYAGVAGGVLFVPVDRGVLLAPAQFRSRLSLTPLHPLPPPSNLLASADPVSTFPAPGATRGHASAKKK
ncbi:hypothetical protein PR048_031347 [Dryococelus australis]|uniref:Uncharacterized protein n=1 Tax=Dryococelus australis TaxID=614101 RepID=A0ABQ9G508_9NEOP|nr:hypothetical protein PR048_031347 [Dryococelus australis]